MNGANGRRRGKRISNLPYKKVLERKFYFKRKRPEEER